MGAAEERASTMKLRNKMAWSSPVWVTSSQRIEDMHGDLP